MHRSTCKCFGCGAEPNKKTKRFLKTSNADAPPSEDSDGYIEVGGTKKQRRKAKAKAKREAESGSKQTDESAATGSDAPGGPEADEANVAEATDEHREVSEQIGALEAMPKVARGFVADFDRKLEELKARKAEMDKERKGAKPWKWRLLAAQRQVDRANERKNKTQTDIDETEKQIAEMQRKLG